VPPALVLMHIAGSVAVWMAALVFVLDLTAHSVETSATPTDTVSVP
jgi:hypothetical protein